MNKPIVIGFSNGANIAATLLLSYLETIKGAILFRAKILLIPDNLTDLSGKQKYYCPHGYRINSTKRKSMLSCMTISGWSIQYNPEIATSRT